MKYKITEKPFNKLAKSFEYASIGHSKHDSHHHSNKFCDHELHKNCDSHNHEPYDGIHVHRECNQEIPSGFHRDLALQYFARIAQPEGLSWTQTQMQFESQETSKQQIKVSQELLER